MKSLIEYLVAIFFLFQNIEAILPVRGAAVATSKHHIMTYTRCPKKVPF